MEEERKRAFLKYREKYISALRQSGMSRGELRMLMKGENIGSQAVKSLMSNRYYRYEPTADTIKDGRRKGAKNGEDRVGAFNDIRDQHDRVQPLSEDDRES